MPDIAERLLAQLHHPGLASIDLGLERVERFLALVGSPHKRLPPVIHVAGTNGKGSTLAYVQAIFEQAGYSVHRYTSPHLVRFNERITIAGKLIDTAYLELLLERVLPHASAQPVTFFEATTAMAFLAFAENPADVLLLETGMGGRLDATNVVEKPLLTAITPVSLDHTEFLGTTLSDIATEKAGIMKRGVPCVVGRQESESSVVIAQHAEELNATLWRHGLEWEIQWQGDKAMYQSRERSLTLKPALVGHHQYENAAAAVACIDNLPMFNISDHHIMDGLASAVWPARLQHLTQGRYADMLPKNIELWLDGGHNAQGGEALAHWLSGQKDREIYLICGMVKTKRTQPYLRPMLPYIKKLYAVAIPGEPTSKAPEQVEMAARTVGIPVSTAESVENALQTIAAHAKTQAIVVICGSLYLAGSVLAANGN